MITREPFRSWWVRQLSPFSAQSSREALQVKLAIPSDECQNVALRGHFHYESLYRAFEREASRPGGEFGAFFEMLVSNRFKTQALFFSKKE